MKISLFQICGGLVILLLFVNLTVRAQNKNIRLIAHRGGVVDSSYTENGLPALKKAKEYKYAMIETDMRVTKDGVLIANHDATFERYYGLKQKVTEMNWADVEKLSSKIDGNTPLKLESVFEFCSKNQMNVMLDNKIEGLNIALFNQLLALLDRYNLRENALMIGTDESTEFFTGKIKLSCTRKQLEENITRKNYKPSDYFLFERPAKMTKDDVDWANNNGIITVAAINKYHYKNSENMYKEANDDCIKMASFGVKYFQIDSEFADFLK
ncbi:glycerophosphodiester phosphodiesterase family protein [Dyadobacter sp. CY356]|uniref:glycerophosphodiester phosphodiesterase n=1 Tax=Dyadobacter sp. CY356 TaxID=2906442 RepID=UPI001F2749E4|nr:glycerophosphodiester phosphodiesterase family protein [Dyadobacter sp. CY356]MCF0054413.1 hypothetical protein [Dyadobacter sp. CY356]